MCLITSHSAATAHAMQWPQMVIDVSIVCLASAFTVFSLVHIVLLWCARGDFFVVIRSPVLACVAGVCINARYLASVYYLILGERAHAHIVDLVMFPAVWAAQAAVVLMAARLVVMYYPVQRVKYGRCTKENRLVRLLGYTFVLTEAAVWATAAALGTSRASSIVVWLGQLPPVMTIAAITYLGWQLRHVHDMSNMARDIRLVAKVMMAAFVINALVRLLLRPDSLEKKYGMIVFLTISHPPIVWILNVRSVRDILGDQCALPFSRGDARVAITTSSRASCTQSTRLAVIMAMDSLRAAFGEFCHKSLCMESFLFLEDISEFKSDILSEAEGDARLFKGFGAYVSIVNDYIKEGSHWEVNVSSKAKIDILRHTTFVTYKALDTDERVGLFSVAEQEVFNLLADNLLNKFMLSEEYKSAIQQA